MTEHDRNKGIRVNREAREESAKSGFQFVEDPWISLLTALIAYFTVLIIDAVLETLYGIPGESPNRHFPTRSHLIMPIGLLLTRMLKGKQEIWR